MALAALVGVVLLVDESIVVTSFGFDWSASFDHGAGTSPVDAILAVAGSGPTSGVF
jgi:hypothetical protein